MTDQAMITLGGFVVLAGSLLLYLASPNQRAWRQASAQRPLAWAGLVVVVAGTALLLTSAGPATAIFIAFTIAMLAWTVTPLLVAWWHRPRGNAE